MIRPTPDLAPISAGQFIREAAQGELERYARELRESGVEVRTRVELGDPIDVILEVSGEIEPAMIVMGTQGRTGLAHFLIGSVAEKIMRKSDRPVLTVPAAATEHEEQLEVVER